MPHPSAWPCHSFPNCQNHLQPSFLLFCHHRRLIVSDWCPHFTSCVWLVWPRSMEKLEISISQLLDTIHNPTTKKKGQIKRQCFCKFSALKIKEIRLNSSNGLNISILTVTICCPANSISVHTWIPTTSVPCSLVQEEYCKLVWKGAHQQLQQVGQRTKNFADQRKGENPTYHHNHHIWLATKDFRNTFGCNKLNVKYIGPYKVLQRINDVTYKHDLPCQCHHSPTFRVSQLKQAI